MNIICDTSVLIDFLRKKEPQNTLFYEIINNNSEIIISLITATELYSGKSAGMKNGSDKLEDLLSGLTIAIPDMNIAQKTGRLQNQYQMSIADAFIAALAIKLNLPLATLDNKAFKRVKGLKLYDNPKLQLKN